MYEIYQLIKNSPWFKTIILLFLMLYSMLTNAQIAEDSQLFQVLKKNDSLFFEKGFNQLDMIQVQKMTSESLEMYHDQGGITSSKQAFVSSMAGLGKMDYKATRELIPGSLKVYPLYDQGELYGALQKGEHRFYALEKNKPRYLTSTAKFTVLWIKEQEEWKMSRIFSYDHIAPTNK